METRRLASFEWHSNPKLLFLKDYEMTNCPQHIFELYSKWQISKDEFIYQLIECQKANNIDYSFTKTVGDLDIYFTYQNITAIIKNNKLHFKTDQNEKASTPLLRTKG